MKVHIQLVSRDSAEAENRVFVQGREIYKETSLLIRNHSPDGFAWGYHGSGPAQTALGICLELFGPNLAPRVYQQFKSEFIGGIKEDGEYHIELTGFFKEYVWPELQGAVTEWAGRFIWSLSENSNGILECEAERFDFNRLLVYLTIPAIDEAFDFARRMSASLGLFSLVYEADRWLIEAKFPLTDTMIGLLTEYALNQTSDALNDFGNALSRAKETAKKLSLETL